MRVLAALVPTRRYTPMRFKLKLKVEVETDLEYDHASVVASCKEIEGGVAGNHPEPVILPPEVSK